MEQWTVQYSSLGGIDHTGIQLLSNFVNDYCEYLEQKFLQKGEKLCKDTLKIAFEHPLEE